MNMADLYSDRVTLVKADGSIAGTDLLAVVGKGTIQLHDGTLLIQSGDHLLRTLPNGLVEDYLVIEPHFHSGLGISYYEVEVQKSTAAAQPRQAAIQHITNIFHGANSRANFNSVDNSLNVTAALDLEQVRDFAAQVRATRSSLPSAQQDSIVAPLAELENAAHAADPDPSRVLAAVRSVKAVAEGAAGNLVASGIASLATSILTAAT